MDVYSCREEKELHDIFLKHNLPQQVCNDLLKVISDVSPATSAEFAIPWCSGSESSWMCSLDSMEPRSKHPMFQLCMTSFWNSRVMDLLREKILQKVCSGMLEACLGVFEAVCNMHCDGCQVLRLMAVQSWKCSTKTHIRCCWRSFKSKRPKERCTGNHKTWGIFQVWNIL